MRHGASSRRSALPRPRLPLRQLNLKISESTYQRIKALAYRDRLSLETPMLAIGLFEGEEIDGAVRRQMEYWTAQLAGAPEYLELPTGGPRPAVQTFSGGMCRRRLDARCLEQLRQLTPQVAQSDVVLYQPETAYRMHYPEGVDKHGPVGLNPPNGAC